MRFEATVNGRPVSWEIAPHDFLTEVLRREGLIGTKRGCEQGDCGTCSVLIDGREVNSCIVLAAQAAGHDIVTIEGLGTFDAPHPVQAAFVDAGAVQCGYCTPGMIIATKALLDRTPSPTRDDAKAALAGHLCRCTGYAKPLDAMMLAAARLAVDSLAGDGGAS